MYEQYDDQYDDQTLKQVEKLQQEVEYLRGRVNALESERQMQPAMTGLPDTWLLSHSLLKRAFGVYGLSLLAGFLISIPFLCLYFVLILMFGVMGN